MFCIAHSQIIRNRSLEDRIIIAYMATYTAIIYNYMVDCSHLSGSLYGNAIIYMADFFTSYLVALNKVIIYK